MIGGIGSVAGAVTAAAARFDRAAVGVVSAAESEAEPDVASASGGLSDAIVAMAVERFALLASLQTARVSNEMIAQSLQLGA